MDEWIEGLRKELHEAMDSQDKELCLKISQELDKAILEYIRGGGDIKKYKTDRP